MVNTRIDADLSVAVQNTLQTLLPQIRAEIREEFHTSSGPSDAGGNPHRLPFILGLNALTSKIPIPLRRRQLPWTRRIGSLTWRRSLMLWVTSRSCSSYSFFPRAEHESLKREYHSIRQMNTKTSMEFMQRFLRLAGFLKAAAGTEEEQAKNFQWGLRMSTLNHLMCMSYTDVAQVANAARNYEILHERDDDDTERPDKRQKSGDRHQPTSQQSSHRNRGHNNDHHRSDRRVFVIFDTGATHSVISSAFASRVTTTPTLLDHVLCISTPMQDSVRITHVYRNLPLQFDDKIHAINALPLDMCEFDIIL
nr:hypothetical protein [Tanacetum cinerariifolium]